MTKKRNRAPYMRTHITEHRRKIKIRAVAYKGGKCEVCRYDKCIQAMEFHHPDPKAKDFHISHSSYSWETVRREIEKCQLLCCRCHREVHAEWDAKSRAQTLSEKQKLRVELGLNAIAIQPKKVEWPSSEELKDLVGKMPVAAIARRVGVSGVSLLSRLKKLGISNKPTGYWSQFRKRKSAMNINKFIEDAKVIMDKNPLPVNKDETWFEDQLALLQASDSDQFDVHDAGWYYTLQEMVKRRIARIRDDGLYELIAAPAGFEPAYP